MEAGAGSTEGSRRLPVLDLPARRRVPDLARGARGLVIWAIPIGLLAVASWLRQASLLPGRESASLLVVGTAGFGLLCLANAVRCGRVHCWIDGTALPALAAIGTLGVVGAITIPWADYLPILWGIVLLSFLGECATGPYIVRRPRRRDRAL